MSGHTKGPWVVQLAKGSYQRPAFVETADHTKVVAGCFGNQLEPDATSIREAEANARLIAAAPELLEALEDAVDRLAVCARLTGNAEWAIDAMLAKHRAAIAKARGQ